MSQQHVGGNAIPEITREEHRSVNGVNAKATAPYVFDGTNLVPQKGNSSGVTASDLYVDGSPVSGANPVNVTGTVTGGSYATQIDTSTTNVIYIGTANPGTATSAASWQIRKFNTASGVVVTFADGNSNFDNIWDNRASLSYS